MEKIKEYIKKHEYIDFIIIILFMFVFFILFANHFGAILSDRGREFLLPQEILNGAVPYKDIILIYFPFSYYINALIYKLLGISFNSLLISQSIICTVFLIFYYLLSREFLGRCYSLLITILIISCCIFAKNDLFSYIIPYAYGRVYGVLGILICTYALVKLHKTDNIKYAYLAGIMSGFSVCCKMEFFTAVIIFLIGILTYKNFKKSDYLKILLFFLIFPVICISILVIQGVSINDLISALQFGLKFASSEVMTRHLVHAGIYPSALLINSGKILNGLLNVFILLYLLFFGLRLQYVRKSYIYLVCVYIFSFKCCYNPFVAEAYWLWLPIAILIIFIILFKRIKNDMPLLIILTAAIITTQREFFYLSLGLYGTYSFPLMFLSFIIIVDRFFYKEILKVKVKHLFCSLIIILIVFYFQGNMIKRNETEFEIKTNKGTFYTNYNIRSAILNTRLYLEKYTDKDATILVLPEGNIINYITNRKVDMHCFMMDRLYHDAYGDEKARDMIAQTNSDYIILIRGFDTNNFARHYLYRPKQTYAAKYIFDNYTEVLRYKNYTGNIIILKRNDYKK